MVKDLPYANILIKCFSIGISNLNKNEIKNLDASVFAYRLIALIEGSILLAKTLEKPEILMESIDFLQSEINSLKI